MTRNTIARRIEHMWDEISHARSPAKVLDYGIMAFGPEKKETLFRLTKKSLFENNFFTVQYIAFVDVFVIAGLLLWASGHPYGFPIFIFFLVMAVIVFVDQRELAKRAHQMKGPMKKTAKVVMRETPKVLANAPRVVEKISKMIKRK